MTMRPVATFALGTVFGVFLSQGFHRCHNRRHEEWRKRGWPCRGQADKEDKPSSADPEVVEATATATHMTVQGA
ncbi:hypothetical protein BT93_G0997 [Corymbia citriodora subsp. variegata]|nr:hypothetical protein BT93_G0997 [Corymbia citriodora subsp. variegata]